MSQPLTFDKAVQQVYFNVDVKNASVDSIINDFAKVAQDYNVSNEMSSLSIILDMNKGGKATKVFYSFKFIKSPLFGTTIDSGYIKVSVGKVGNIKKIISIDWCFLFLTKENADVFFDKLEKIFIPLSTKQKVINDELNLGKYAEFSTRKDNEKGVKDVTFSLNKSINGDEYEVRFIPYNEFSE